MPSNWTTVDYKTPVDRGGHLRNPLIENGLTAREVDNGGGLQDLQTLRAVLAELLRLPRDQAGSAVPLERAQVLVIARETIKACG